MNWELRIPSFDWTKHKWFTDIMTKREKLIKECQNSGSVNDHPLVKTREFKDPNSDLHIDVDGNMRWGNYVHRKGFVYYRDERTGLPDNHIFTTLPSRITKEGYMFWYIDHRSISRNH